jgi:hypothetical protein
MPAFARTIGIDYSGAETPTASLKGLRIYMAEGDRPPEEVFPPPSPRKYWTRKGIAHWLVERLAEYTLTRPSNCPTKWDHLSGVDPRAAFRAKAECANRAAFGSLFIRFESAGQQLELILVRPDHHAIGRTGVNLTIRAMTVPRQQSRDILP